MASALPPGARVVPLNEPPTNNRASTLSRASPALTRMRAARLLPDTTARARGRVLALKTLYAQPITTLKIQHDAALKSAVKKLQLSKLVRNVRVATDATGSGHAQSVVGSLCVPLNTCCALPGMHNEGPFMSSSPGSSSMQPAMPSAVAVTGAVDGLLTVWDVDTCKPLANASSCEGNQWGRVRSLAAYPTPMHREDGARLFFSTTMFDRRIGVWTFASSQDSTRSECSSTWRLDRITDSETAGQHIAGVNQLAVDPTGSLLASTGDDATLRLWSAVDICEGSTTPGPAAAPPPLAHLCTQDGYERAGRVLGVAFHPDGSLVATADAGGRVVAWDTRSGGLAFTTVTGVNSKANSVRRGAHLSAATCVAWSPCGVRFASGGADTVVQLWDARSLHRNTNSSSNSGSGNGAAFQMLGHTDTVTSLSFYSSAFTSNDAKDSAHPSILPVALLSTSLDGTVRLWDANTGLMAHTLHAGSPVRAHCRPVPSSRPRRTTDNNDSTTDHDHSALLDTSSAAAILTVGHTKYWSVWDVLDGDADAATASRSASAGRHMVHETGTLVTSGRAAGATTRGRDADECSSDEDDDDDSEMALLMKKPKQLPGSTAATTGQNEEEGVDDSGRDEDDEMEMLKKKRRN